MVYKCKLELSGVRAPRNNLTPPEGLFNFLNILLNFTSFGIMSKPRCARTWVLVVYDPLDQETIETAVNLIPSHIEHVSLPFEPNYSLFKFYQVYIHFLYAIIADRITPHLPFERYELFPLHSDFRSIKSDFDIPNNPYCLPFCPTKKTANG